MEDRVLEYLERNLNELGVKVDDSLLVAWSGGLDSTLLVYLLAVKLGRRVEGFYYNHGLRSPEELNKEVEFLNQYSDEWGVTLHQDGLSQGKMVHQARGEGRSIEEVAREYRYRSLASLYAKGCYNLVFTAHHQDDQVETMLHRFFQGSSVMGLGSFKRNSQWGFPLLRPLWNISRCQIEASLELNGLSFSEDSSNRDIRFSRNTLRHSILPVIKESYPALNSSMGKSCEKNDLIQDFLRQSLENMDEQKEEGLITIDMEAFKELHGALRMEWLYRSADQLLRSKGRGYRLPYRFLRPWIYHRSGPFKTLRGHGLWLRCWKGRLAMVDLEAIPPFMELKAIRHGETHQIENSSIDLLSGNSTNAELTSSSTILLPVPRGLELQLGCPPLGYPWKKAGYKKKRQQRYAPELRETLRYITAENRILLCLRDKPEQIQKDWKQFIEDWSKNNGTEKLADHYWLRIVQF